MKKITQENLAEFKPEFGDYYDRVEQFAQLVGVDTPEEQRDYSGGLREWSRSSAIGFSDAELDIIELVHSVAKENQRYDNDPFLGAEHGGNTAEHPIFMGLAFDKFRRDAGFGVETFDPDSPETLRIAQISQAVHAMAAVHDFGELVDISYGEMALSGASRKEPDEEALVAPFQIKLAAYALSTGQEELFGNTIRELKAVTKEAKKELFARTQLPDGDPEKITGDEFVTQFGKVIGGQIDAAESSFTEADIKPEYLEAVENLQELFHQAEHGAGIEGKLFASLDKYEGSAHYARYAGRAADQFAAAQGADDPEQNLINRMFGEEIGDNMSYSLQHSSEYVGQVQYTVKTVAKMFDELENVPEEEREAVEKLVRSAAANVVRITIPLMQKGPAFVDFDADKTSDPAAKPVEQGTDESFATRFENQRRLKDEALPKLRERRGHVDVVEGVMDAKAIIAVTEKTAAAIESGEFTPDGSSKTIFPVGEELPEALKVSPSDLKASNEKYPLDVASQFKGDQFRGESVRL